MTGYPVAAAAVLHVFGGAQLHRRCRAGRRRRRRPALAEPLAHVRQPVRSSSRACGQVEVAGGALEAVVAACIRGEAEEPRQRQRHGAEKQVEMSERKSERRHARANMYIERMRNEEEKRNRWAADGDAARHSSRVELSSAVGGVAMRQNQSTRKAERSVSLSASGAPTLIVLTSALECTAAASCVELE